jgi:ABC-type dipeptide/oligopeptide/nickel transport system permease subunit
MSLASDSLAARPLPRPPPPPRRNSPFWATMRRIRRHRGAVVGFWALVLITLAALLAPLLAPYDPLAMNPARSLPRRGPSTGSAPTSSAATSSAACSTAPASR